MDRCACPWGTAPTTRCRTGYNGACLWGTVPHSVWFGCSGDDCNDVLWNELKLWPSIHALVDFSQYRVIFAVSSCSFIAYRTTRKHTFNKAGSTGSQKNAGDHDQRNCCLNPSLSPVYALDAEWDHLVDCAGWGLWFDLCALYAFVAFADLGQL